MQFLTYTYLQPKNFINQNIRQLILQIVHQKNLLEGFFEASEQTLVFNFIISVDNITVTVNCSHRVINSLCTFTIDTLWGFHAVLDYVVDTVSQIKLRKDGNLPIGQSAVLQVFRCCMSDLNKVLQ